MLFALPLLLLFQNCGTTSSDGGTESRSSQESENYRNHTSSGLRGAGGNNTNTGGSSGGGTGTFSFGGGTGGGNSSGGGSFSGGGTGGGGNGESGGTGQFDGRNCFAGNFALDETILRAYTDRNNSRVLQNFRDFVAYGPSRTVGMPTAEMAFPNAASGGTHTISCAVAKVKMRVFFPPIYFTNEYVEMDNTSNVTTLQCRGGFWYFAGTSCRWMRRIDLENQNNRP